MLSRYDISNPLTRFDGLVILTGSSQVNRKVKRAAHLTNKYVFQAHVMLIYLFNRNDNSDNFCS